MFQCSTLSPLKNFQIERKLNKVKTRCADAHGLIAYPHYFLELEQKLTDEEQQKCLKLLNADTALQEPIETCAKVIVVPRIGTISPWSTKATDILHNCDLTSVKRIEQGMRYFILCDKMHHPEEEITQMLAGILYDPLTESILFDERDAEVLFSHNEPKPVQHIDILNGGMPALEQANQEKGFALSGEEMEYLLGSYQALDRNPSDVELMMFAQINSEHCRHKIFNADWRIDHQAMNKSLFGMIKETYEASQAGVITAYKDNAAIIEGFDSQRFFADPHGRQYHFNQEPIHIVFKVETHNHPTAISPFPGAATGSGGEIRDEGATGRGAVPKAGLTGFSVSHLHIPDYPQPWEYTDAPQPAHLASALDIMLEGPIGGASFNNEFGRPNICGYFRNFELMVDEGREQTTRRGYHKPIMIAGGIGNIRDNHCQKQDIPPKAVLIVLGGPAMRIGLGGGAASSMTSGTSSQALDFASVQRGNPEMQRRAQEVINACWALGDDNPILSIHDVGAGGLSNALPEIVHDSARGASVELRMVLSDEPDMSPLEVWCNEAQERYVLAIHPEDLDQFSQIARRERCPFAAVGQAIDDDRLLVGDGYFDNSPIDVPMSLLFGQAPKMLRDTHHYSFHKTEFNTQAIDLTDAIERVLRFPTVASKEFLITIGDRTVTGLISRDQMVGPWQVPVADCAVTASGYLNYTGEAMAMGERSPVAVLHPAASGRLAVAEAITNIASADIKQLTDIKLSANWMAAASFPGEDAALFDTVKAVAVDMCKQLGMIIPVGKDSLSMQTVWQQDGAQQQVVSPLSLIISACAPVQDIRRTLTPQLVTKTKQETVLLLLDLGKGQQRLGASILAQTYQQLGHHAPDCDDIQSIKAFFNFIQANRDKILAYHDRSDGGLLVTLMEMAFAGHCGLHIDTSALGEDPIASLFNEELGVVIQVASSDVAALQAQCHELGLGHHIFAVATLRPDDNIVISHQQQKLYQASREQCQRLWTEVSYQMQARRDNPDCAKQAFDSAGLKDDPGLSPKVTFDLASIAEFPQVVTGIRPRVAILREQGVNGHMEMAAAFHHAGFDCVDVHMDDLLQGNMSLNKFNGLVACGGFSFGDVLGAGRGWANSIQYHSRARDAFAGFFERRDNFVLGVCNGCQMLSQLKEIIPGTAHWPEFLGNLSGQFEARLSLVEIVESSSLFFKDMAGSLLPVAVAHGEGRMHCRDSHSYEKLHQNQQICLRYVDNWGSITERYPANPNGSPHGVTGVSSEDGRIMIMMPHPERVFMSHQLSWHPQQWPAASPWFKMFVNAREWLAV